jgi:hypothetical protein
MVRHNYNDLSLVIRHGSMSQKAHSGTDIRGTLANVYLWVKGGKISTPLWDEIKKEKK